MLLPIFIYQSSFSNKNNTSFSIDKNVTSLVAILHPQFYNDESAFIVSLYPYINLTHSILSNVLIMIALKI